MSATALLLFLLFISRHHLTAAASPAAACRNSVHPKLCRSLLAPLPLPKSSYDYGRFSVKRALKQARRTSTMLDDYLRNDAEGSWRQALEDCRELMHLSVDYLEAVQAELGSWQRKNARAALGSVAAERVKTLMSSLVTNQMTCLDGLQESKSFDSQLYSTFAEESELYHVSLELVTNALDRRRSDGAAGESESNRIERQLMGGGAGRLPSKHKVTVAKDGSGNFSTISNAIAFAPDNATVEDGYFTIVVKEGVYRENIIVHKNKKNLIIIGAGINKTVITSNRSVTDPCTSTYNSSTFAVNAERFIAINITFENSAGRERFQAVAVRNNADLSVFYRCSFLGYQDTLYVHSNRQFYRDCEIYGTVDFIFGNAASVFQNCHIYARKPLSYQFNVITAQGRTHLNQTTGISIHNCTIQAAPDLAGDPNSTQSYLGRPWKEFSRTVYMQSYIGSLIEPEGWKDWNGTSSVLSTLFYGEYKNYGPGSNTSRRVKWPGYTIMNATQALNFTVSKFTTGDYWLPSTSIPFHSGLQ